MSNQQGNTSQDSKRLGLSWFWVLKISFFLALASFILPRQLPLFFSLEHKYADIRTTLAGPKNSKQFQDFIFIKITESDLREMTYRSPIDRSWLASLIKEIDRRNPKAIGVNIQIDQPTEPHKDQILIDTIKSVKSKIIFSKIDRRKNVTPFQEEYNHWFLQQTGANYGVVNISADQDDVIRQLPQPIDQGSELSFADAVVSGILDGSVPATRKNEQISWLRDVSKQFPAYRDKPASFITDQSEEVDLSNTVVLIGQDISDLDRHKTPFNSWGRIEEGMAGSRIIGQIIVQRMEGRRLKIIPGLFEFLLYFLSAILGFIFASRLENISNQKLIFWSLNIAVILVDIMVFKLFSLLVPTAMMLFTFVLAIKLPSITAIISFSYNEFKSKGFSK